MLYILCIFLFPNLQKCQFALHPRQDRVTILGVRLIFLDGEKNMLWSKWQKSQEDATLTLDAAQRCLRTSFFAECDDVLHLLR